MKLQLLIYVELILVRLLSIVTGQAVQRKGKLLTVVSLTVLYWTAKSDIPGETFHAVIAAAGSRKAFVKNVFSRNNNI